jgi:hypothetical protein
MPNDPAVSAIPWGLEMTGRAVLWVMDRASLRGAGLVGRRSSIRANLSSDLEANRERLCPLFWRPRAPTRPIVKFWKKQNRPCRNFLAKNKIRKTECKHSSTRAKSARSNRFYRRHTPVCDHPLGLFRNATGFQDRNVCFSRHVDQRRHAVRSSQLAPPSIHHRER